MKAFLYKILVIIRRDIWMQVISAMDILRQIYEEIKYFSHCLGSGCSSSKTFLGQRKSYHRANNQYKLNYILVV